ncbi:unnamed protein product, partial [Amoebophrya sp. A120]
PVVLPPPAVVDVEESSLFYSRSSQQTKPVEKSMYFYADVDLLEEDDNLFQNDDDAPASDFLPDHVEETGGLTR